jgi:amino acid transporter
MSPFLGKIYILVKLLSNYSILVNGVYMKLKKYYLIILILVLISLILSIISAILPWYYVKLDIEELNTYRTEGTYNIEDSLGGREKKLEYDDEGGSSSGSDYVDNEMLKDEYPDTANYKNITNTLFWILIFLIFIFIVVLSIINVKPKINFTPILFFIYFIFIFSILIVSYFTFQFDPVAGDKDHTNNPGYIDNYYEIEVERSGTWFYQDTHYTGEMVGSGKSGVSSGYVLTIIAIIFLFIAMVLSSIAWKKLQKTQTQYLSDKKSDRS